MFSLHFDKIFRWFLKKKTRENISEMGNIELENVRQEIEKYS